MLRLSLILSADIGVVMIVTGIAYIALNGRNMFIFVRSPGNIAAGIHEPDSSL